MRGACFLCSDTNKHTYVRVHQGVLAAQQATCERGSCDVDATVNTCLLTRTRQADDVMDELTHMGVAFVDDREKNWFSFAPAVAGEGGSQESLPWGPDNNLGKRKGDWSCPEVRARGRYGDADFGLWGGVGCWVVCKREASGAASAAKVALMAVSLPIDACLILMPAIHSPVATSFFSFLPHCLTLRLLLPGRRLAFSVNSLSYSAVPTYSRARAHATAAPAHAPAALAQWHATSTRTIEGQVGAISAVAAEKTGAGEGKAGATRLDKALHEAAAGAALRNSCPLISCMSAPP